MLAVLHVRQRKKSEIENEDSWEETWLGIRERP